MVAGSWVVVVGAGGGVSWWALITASFARTMKQDIPVCDVYVLHYLLT